ncbi:MAG TPA: WGR domain-containing protein, partial [Gemmataceae bacterium]|nr:WGR domain-containing protein [Gemmataceae bacterium]
MRTFTFSQGRSNKFWNIELRGCGFTVVYGRIGTTGATLSKTFADEATARKEHDKLVQEKLAKGYVETTPKGKGLKEALEEALLENPDDLAAASAYADYLIEQGDPQGELIQVQLALEDEGRPAAERKELQKREQALFKKYGEEWVGEWARLTTATGPEGRAQLDFPGPKPCRFIRGLLAEVTLDELDVACARALVRAPQTRFVRRLFLGGFDLEEPEVTENEDEPARIVLLRWQQLAHLRVFQFGWTSDEEYGDFCHFQCHLWGRDAVAFVKQMPRLEELYLFAHLVDADALFALPLPNLRVLQLYHSDDYPLEELAENASLGRLTHLLCHPHALEPGDE